MDLKQLEYFVRVAELGSFTRASMALNVAQPALSRQVPPAGRLRQERGCATAGAPRPPTLELANGPWPRPAPGGAVRAKNWDEVRGALAEACVIGCPPSL
jgi:LysR family nitrogen assimilation transcriptional regulator